MKYLRKRAIVRPILGFFDRGWSFHQAVVIPALAEASTFHQRYNLVQSGGTSWETGAERRIRKRAGNRTPINSSKRQKTRWRGSRKESPEIFFTAAI
jgi:hypothetical protein